MDLATAIDEYVSMLILGSEALRRLAKGDAKHEAQAPIEHALDEIRSAAERLAAIGKGIRGDDA